jgi:hypothetical protein
MRLRKQYIRLMCKQNTEINHLCTYHKKVSHLYRSVYTPILLSVLINQKRIQYLGLGMIRLKSLNYTLPYSTACDTNLALKVEEKI